MKKSWWLLWRSPLLLWPVGAGALFLACAPLSRNEPSLAEKCESLALFCQAAPRDRTVLRDCLAVGRRGVNDANHADQCFAAYDECIDLCHVYYEIAAEADAAATAASSDGGAN
jgi:hypothetical protein